MSEILLGKKYKDIITGFEGIATGFVEYLSGCNQVLLTPKVLQDGNKIEAHWIDNQRLQESLPNEIIKLPLPTQNKTFVLLGNTYQDLFTGFKGVAIGRTHHMTRNEDDILLAPHVGSDGQKRDNEWFPESFLKPLTAEQIKLENGKKPGSDREAPKY